MSSPPATDVPRSAAQWEVLTGVPLADTEHDCHSASLRLVKALGRGRVARGVCRDVPGQHSWVVLGDDCYAPDAQIADPTLWSYRQQHPHVWVGTARAGLHRPHGSQGNIWTYGRPPDPIGPVVELAVDPGPAARGFLALAAPNGLDLAGWAVLLTAPVSGWPAAEVVAAAYQTPALTAWVPIDRAGMLTDLNPQGLYRW